MSTKDLIDAKAPLDSLRQRLDLLQRECRKHPANSDACYFLDFEIRHLDGEIQKREREEYDKAMGGNQ